MLLLMLSLLKLRAVFFSLSLSSFSLFCLARLGSSSSTAAAAAATANKAANFRPNHFTYSTSSSPSSLLSQACSGLSRDYEDTFVTSKSWRRAHSKQALYIGRSFKVVEVVCSASSSSSTTTIQFDSALKKEEVSEFE